MTDEPNILTDLIVQGNREMVTHAIRAVAAETRIDADRFRLDEAIDSDYGPCLVVHFNTQSGGGVGSGR